MTTFPASVLAHHTAVFVKQDKGPRPGMRGRFSDEHWALKQFPEVRP